MLDIDGAEKYYSFAKDYKRYMNVVMQETKEKQKEFIEKIIQDNSDCDGFRFNKYLTINNTSNTLDTHEFNQYIISSSTIKTILNSLSKIKDREIELNLSGHGPSISDSEIKTFVKNNKNVVRVDFSDCDISSKGINYFIENNRIVNKVKLSGIDKSQEKIIIGSDGLNKIVSAMKKNPNLEIIIDVEPYLELEKIDSEGPLMDPKSLEYENEEDKLIEKIKDPNLKNSLKEYVKISRLKETKEIVYQAIKVENILSCLSSYVSNDYQMQAKNKEQVDNYIEKAEELINIYEKNDVLKADIIDFKNAVIYLKEMFNNFGDSNVINKFFERINKLENEKHEDEIYFDTTQIQACLLLNAGGIQSFIECYEQDKEILQIDAPIYDSLIKTALAKELLYKPVFRNKFSEKGLKELIALVILNGLPETTKNDGDFITRDKLTDNLILSAYDIYKSNKEGTTIEITEEILKEIKGFFKDNNNRDFIEPESLDIGKILKDLSKIEMTTQYLNKRWHEKTSRNNTNNSSSFFEPTNNSPEKFGSFEEIFEKLKNNHAESTKIKHFLKEAFDFDYEVLSNTALNQSELSHILMEKIINDISCSNVKDVEETQKNAMQMQ